MENLIDIKNIKYSEDRWFISLQDSAAITFVRKGRHLIYADRDKWGRWIIIPIEAYLRKGIKYKLLFKLLCNYTKVSVPVYLLNRKNETQTIFKFSMNENVQTEFIVEFSCDLDEADSIMLTATNFPLSGELLQISDFRLLRV